MIAAIAHIGGHDVNDDRVKTLVYTCLAGNSAREIIQETGIVIANQFAINAVKSIPGKSLAALNRKVGFRLLTKFGEKGAINLGKAVPLAGGVMGLAIDSGATLLLGKVAKSMFINQENDTVKNYDTER